LLSAAMMEVAKTKTVSQPVTYCQDNTRTFLKRATEAYDYVLSTYMLHHLAPAEKSVAFQRCYELLNPGGVALFGDLMFEDADARRSLREQFRQQGWTGSLIS
jgi:2-polyprenyl-3-methyl-5-hydroxy-6-metoxy-1,4-benzoquinol methylase